MHRGGKNLEEALAALRIVLADLQRGFDLNIDIDTPWAVLLQKWVEAHDGVIPEGTMRTRKSAIDSRIIPAIGNDRLIEAGITTISKVIDHCVAKGTVNGNTLKGTVSTLRTIGYWAGDRGYLPVDAFGDEKRINNAVNAGKLLIPKHIQARDAQGNSKSKDECPTWDDIVTLAEAAHSVALKRTSEDAWAVRAESAVRVSAGTGLRMCELLGLQVGDIDMQTGIITLWRQLDRYEPVGSERCYAPLKRRESMLKKDSRLVIVWASVKADLQLLIDNADDEGNLFPAPKCARWLADWWGKVLTEACEQSGFAWKPHYLRHHYASYSISTVKEGGLGMSIARVQASLGHKHPETTTRAYLHPTAEGLSGWVE